MKDRWDVIGGAGSALVVAGTWRLAGWPWAAILAGVVLMALYVVHELSAARPQRPRED